MSRVHRRGFARMEAVMTPLIDMGFLLIVFFALVSHLVVVDAAKVELPAPQPSAAAKPGDEPRAVVNAVVGEDGELVSFRLSGRDFRPDAAGMAALGESLASVLRESPGTDINIRADRRVPWRSLAPLVETISRSAAVAAPGRTARVRLVVAEEGRS